MQTHIHQSAQAFKKELDAGLARRFLFPNFSGLIVMQLYMEWAKKNRVSPITKPTMREIVCFRYLVSCDYYLRSTFG